MEHFNIAAMILGIAYLALGLLILAFRSKAISIANRRFTAAASRYESAGRTPPTLTSAAPGRKFVTFVGIATILLGGLAPFLAISQ